CYNKLRYHYSYPTRRSSDLNVKRKWVDLMLEREILGCFLKDNELIKETKVITNYFTHDGNIKIFEKMQSMALNEQVVDKVTLIRSEEHTSELQSRFDIVCRL